MKKVRITEYAILQRNIIEAYEKYINSASKDASIFLRIGLKMRITNEEKKLKEFQEKHNFKI